MIGLIDVNSGNLGSLISALEKIDVKFKICKNKQDLDGLSKILLPGVGSYPNFIKNLKKQCLFSKIKEKVDLKETSIFGICVGFQALFESSDELELTEGLGQSKKQNLVIVWFYLILDGIHVKISPIQDFLKT